jgi:short-subunit dehydrogenase
MFSRDQYGPWALIAGGSEGVAASFARMLAAFGLNLVLVARRAGPLERLASEVSAGGGVEVRTLSLDLAAPDALDRVREVTEDIEVGLLIFNAGNTDDVYGSFLERPLDKALTAVRVMTLSLTSLSHHFGAQMASRGRGGIILVGSLSGAAGVPRMAPYCGAKAYLQIFGEALWSELKSSGIDVLTLVLGVTNTPAKARNGLADVPGMPVHEPDDIAELALGSLEDGGPVLAPPSMAKMFDYLNCTPRRQLAEQLSRGSQ